MRETFQKRNLDSLCSKIYSGGTPSTTNNDYWGGEYYWLSSGETKNRIISSTISTITRLGIENSSTKLARAGDVVIASAGQGKTRGQVSFLTTDMYVNQSIIVLHPIENILDSRFLFYSLSQRYEELRAKSDASSTRGSITTEIMRKENILIPSYNTQKIIGDILFAYDKLIEINARRILILEKIAENLYIEWFARFRFPGYETVKMESGIPKGWEIKTLGEVLKITRGISYSSNEISDDNGILFLNLKSILSYGGYNYSKDSIKYYNNNDISDEQYLNEWDLLMGITDMTQERRLVGSVALVPKFDFSVVFSMDLVKLTPKNKISTIYYYALMKYGGLSRYISQFANGANVLHLKPDSLLRIKYNHPDDKLINKFVKIVSPLFKMIDLYQKKNQNLTVQRELLIPRLISGKLKIQ